jgi:hypothetical protein
MENRGTKSVKECLASLSDDIDFAGCTTLQEEFSVIKKLYFKKVLVAHPDKGGDVAAFREVQTSFEVNIAS